MRRTSVLSLLRMLQENQVLISWRQLDREVGGREEVGLGTGRAGCHPHSNGN